MLHPFSKEDIIDLRQNPSDTTKKRIIDKLMFSFQKVKLSGEERLLAEDILRLLAVDISVSIREAIVEKFAQSRHLPHDVAITLVNDLEDSVAIPAIEKTSCLTESDLIKIIERAGMSRKKAVARREDLSKNMTTLIAYEAPTEVVEEMAKNKKLLIDDKLSEAILSNHMSNEALLRAMIQYKRIDLTQAHDLLIKVSEDLKKLIIVEYDIPSTTVNNLIHESKEWVTLSMLKSHADEAPNSPHVNQIIQKLSHDGELTFSILIKGLSVGNLVFFEAAFAYIAGLPVENLRKLLWETANSTGYKAVYQKCKFPESMQEAMWKLAYIVHEERKKDSAEPITQRIHHSLIKESQKCETKNIDYLLTIVAHNIRKLRK